MDALPACLAPLAETLRLRLTEPAGPPAPILLSADNEGLPIEPPPTGFQDEGDVLLLFSPAGKPEDFKPAAAASGAAEGGACPDPGIDATTRPANPMRYALTGLVLAGGIRSLTPCDSGGLIAGCACASSTPVAGRSTPLGLVLDLVELGAPDPAALEATLLQEFPHQVLVSCGPLEAGRTIERARILDLQARRVGIVGGEGLRFRTSEGEFPVPGFPPTPPGPASPGSVESA